MMTSRLPFPIPVSSLVLVLLLLASGCSTPSGLAGSSTAQDPVSPQASASPLPATAAPAATEPAQVITQQPVADGAPPSPATRATPTPRLAVAPVAGSRAPGFALADLDGVEVSLDGLRGRPVLLNFWATW